MNWFNDCTGMQGGMMMYGMFIFWALLIAIGFILMKSYVNGDTKSSKANHLSILKERLVKGEITEDEFERLKEKL